VLRRVDRPSSLGCWSYEVYDTKLARETRGGRQPDGSWEGGSGMTQNVRRHSSIAELPEGDPARQVAEIAPGAFHLRRFLTIKAQGALVVRCLALLDGSVPAYVPIVRGGGKMRVRMLCLGRHWNGRTYRYEPTRADFDDLPAPPLPEEFRALASEIASSVGMTLAPDICIMNAYGAEGRMGLHQDKDETERSLMAGVPVVSVSLGDTARFLFGGTRRRDPVEALLLESGDAFVFGGPSRLRYHGVSRIIPGTVPQALGLDGRINLTFRQFDVL
jgi:alkylated DNA repair protein (DNA oxidative demethylase)